MEQGITTCPPLGYRLLQVGDVIEKGDRYWDGTRWRESIAYGVNMGVREDCLYCRKIEPGLQESDLRGILLQWLIFEFREISEEHCCSGWAGEIEYSLWRATLCSPIVDFKYGQGTVPAARLQKIRAVADHLGGWLCYRTGVDLQEQGPQFMPYKEWLWLFAQYEKEIEAIISAPDYEASVERTRRWWDKNMRLSSESQE